MNILKIIFEIIVNVVIYQVLKTYSFFSFFFFFGGGGGYFLVNFDVLEASNSKLFIKTEIFLKLAVKIHSYYIHFD